MARPGDRRPFITDQAIAVLADGGARALSHRAVDRAAGLAAGSTSYYFRTRRDLVIATVDRIREHSCAAFERFQMPVVALTPQSAAHLIEGQLRLLVSVRRNDALAVFALLPEVEDDPQLRGRLAGCLFSRELAAHLLSALGGRGEAADSLDLIDFLNGILLGLLFGQRRVEDASAAPVATAVQRFLVSCVAGAAIGEGADAD